MNEQDKARLALEDTQPMSIPALLAREEQFDAEQLWAAFGSSRDPETAP